jgi:hypothetical protein
MRTNFAVGRNNAAIRGHRIGAGPIGESPLSVSVPRVVVKYWYRNHYETTPAFALTAKIPEFWS